MLDLNTRSASIAENDELATLDNTPLLFLEPCLEREAAEYAM